MSPQIRIINTVSLIDPNREEILQKKRQQERERRRRHWNALTDSQRNAIRATRNALYRKHYKPIRLNCRYCSKELERKSIRQHAHMHKRNAKKLIPLTKKQREQVERDRGYI